VIALGARTDERAIIALTGRGFGSTAEPGLRADIYDGSFDVLPDFTPLTPTSTGVSATLTIDAARIGTDLFATRFVGAIEVPTAGTWQFQSASDDGSRVIVGDAVVVDNDGLHGPISVGGSVELTAGRHPFEVQFFEKDGGESLEVRWEGPGVANELIPASVLFTGL
jgi:hypothetical protein